MALNAAADRVGWAAGLRLLPRRSGHRSTNMLRECTRLEEFRSRQWLWVVVLQYSFVMMVFRLSSPCSVGGRQRPPRRRGGMVVGLAAGRSAWSLASWSRFGPNRPTRLVVLLTFRWPGCRWCWSRSAVVGGSRGGVAAGIAVDILVVLWDTTMQREIPAEALSRVSSYDALGTLY
jgi:hypothetical protein